MAEGNAKAASAATAARILAVSANRFLRGALLRLFRSDKELRAVGAVDFSLLLGEQVSRLGPGIVVLSLEQEEAIFRAARIVHETSPKAKILMIGMKDDPELFLKAVQAGAVGYLLKDASPKRILEATHRLARNFVVSPPHLLWAMFRELASGTGGGFMARDEAELTLREQQVSALLVRGLSNKEIADCLNLSLGTVKCHVHNILRKTQSKSRTALARALEPRALAGEAIRQPGSSLAVAH